MRVLVTGSTGFVGKHLLDFLLEKKNIQIIGLLHSPSDKIFSYPKRVDFQACDIRNPKKVGTLLKRVRPDQIYHLAALSNVQLSWENPALFYETNVRGQLNILEAIRKYSPKSHFHAALSSEEYGEVKPNEQPIKETNPLRPLNPYAVTKIAQDYMAYQYFKNFKIHTVRTRSFNHIGPGQTDKFVVSAFAKQVALIESGRQKPEIHVGNLKVMRDFTDVRDVVRGYWLALEKAEPGEVYNICSGRLYSIESVLEFFLKQSKIKVRIVRDPKRLRPNDSAGRLGNYQKFHKRTGWKPEISLKRTLLDVLNNWRELVAS